MIIIIIIIDRYFIDPKGKFMMSSDVSHIKVFSFL